MKAETSDQWFRDNLLPHEPMLRAWLKSQFPREQDLDDVVQDTFLRVLRARESGEVRSPRALLFATARNLVIQNMRKAVRHGEFHLADWDELCVLDEEAGVAKAVARAEQLEILTSAIQSLPTRCRRILTLRKIYGMSQQAIAKELGISVSTVESQGIIGMRKLAQYFARIDRKGR